MEKALSGVVRFLSLRLHRPTTQKEQTTHNPISATVQIKGTENHPLDVTLSQQWQKSVENDGFESGVFAVWARECTIIRGTNAMAICV